MKVYHEEITLDLGPEGDMGDITDILHRVVEKSGVEDGILNVFVVGSTGGVTTIEYESGLVYDFKNTMERLVPKDIDYKHNLRWGDGNGHSHVRASIVKPNIVIPIVKGRLVLGTWQQVVVINFDNRPRRRRVIATCMGL